jgi:hypothetical protein
MAFLWAFRTTVRKINTGIYCQNEHYLILGISRQLVVNRGDLCSLNIRHA